MNRDEKTVFEADRFTVTEVSSWKDEPLPERRQVIRHPGAVAIIPVLDDGRLCLIRNFRIAVGRELIEIPAGTREPGEPIEETAQRELREETGYAAGRIRLLTSLLMSPGIMDEQIDVFLADQLTWKTPDREPGEQIENMVATQAEARELIRNGEIKDSKTISGLLWYWTYEAA